MQNIKLNFCHTGTVSKMWIKAPSLYGSFMFFPDNMITLLLIISSYTIHCKATTLINELRIIGSLTIGKKFNHSRIINQNP